MRYRIIRTMKAKTMLIQNLEWLIEKNKTNPNALEAATKVPQPTIHRILTGESKDPRTNTLQRLADYFCVTVEQLRNSDLSGFTNIEEAPRLRGTVPLISWVQAGIASLAIDNYQPGDYESLVETTVPVGDNTYALRVKGDSMEPLFTEGEILIVEPELSPENGDYIIVRNGDDEATFKKLVKDGSDWYLKPLNSSYKTKLMTEDMIICGVVRASQKILR